MSGRRVPNSESNQSGPSDNFGERLDRIATALERQNEISQKHADGGGEQQDKGEGEDGERQKKQGQGKKRKGFIQKIGGGRTLIIVGVLILLIVIFFGVRYWVQPSMVPSICCRSIWSKSNNTAPARRGKQWC
jgi:cobalamin biosynthesis Mg chelatase CobN